MDSKPGRAPRRKFRLYLVTLRMQAQDGCGYVATRTVRARDPDGAAHEALVTEVRRQAGVFQAGGLAHRIDGVQAVRDLGQVAR